VPANLPPQYYEADKRFRNAKEVDDKIAALQEMLGIMPHHKGTDKLQASLRARIAKLSQESERKLATARRAGFLVRREGAGQVVFAGPANTGKSQLLAALTGASPEIAMYPYTTQTPLPGMMAYKDIQIQLVDTPPLGHRSVRVLLSSVLRIADVIALVVDLGLEPVSQVEYTLGELEESHILPRGASPAETAAEGTYIRKMMIIGNKNDLPGAYGHLKLLTENYGARFRVSGVSALEGEGLPDLAEALYDTLEIIRVYTKAPGQKADMSEPVILRRDATVGEAAEAIHKDFKRELKYAVVWGSGRFQGQTVSKGHVLRDGDVVEFHV